MLILENPFPYFSDQPDPSALKEIFIELSLFGILLYLGVHLKCLAKGYIYNYWHFVFALQEHFL